MRRKGPKSGSPQITDKLRLQPHLVPKPLWGHSASKELGRTSWKQIRQDALEAAGRRCEPCGDQPNPIYGDDLNCHEVWRYDDRRGTATLIGFEIHCAKCDLVTHMGRARAKGYGDGAMEQFVKVSGITKLEARTVFLRAMSVWKKRNAKKWRVMVDEALLKRYPRLAVLQTGNENGSHGTKQAQSELVANKRKARHVSLKSPTLTVMHENSSVTKEALDVGRRVLV